MLVEPFVESSQPLWQDHRGRRLGPPRARAPLVAVNQPDNDTDPDPPPAAPAMRPWPRVFPGL